MALETCDTQFGVFSSRRFNQCFANMRPLEAGDMMELGVWDECYFHTMNFQVKEKPSEEGWVGSNEPDGGVFIRVSELECYILSIHLRVS